MSDPLLGLQPSNLALLLNTRRRAALGAVTLGRISKRAPPSFAFPSFAMVLFAFLPFQTRPTWAYPAHYTLALASSVFPMLRLLTRLAVRSARTRGPDEVAAFPCSTTFTG